MIPMINDFMDAYDLDDVVVVADAGMISAANKQALERAVDCWAFFGQCLFVFQAAFVKSRKSRSTSSGVRYPRAE